MQRMIHLAKDVLIPTRTAILGICLVWAVIALLGMLGVANAQDTLPGVVPTIPPGQEAGWLVDTFQSARHLADERLWGPFVSVLLMAGLSIFSFLFLRWQDLRTRLKPYMGELAMLLSVLGYIGVGLATLPAGASGADWWGVIGPAIKTGLAAVGGYELLVKRLLHFWAPKLWAAIQALAAKIKS